MRRLSKFGVIIGAGLLAAGCTAGSGSSTGGSGKSTGSASTNSVLTISNENGATWTCGFSPFNSSDTLVSVGFVYEPLVYVNPLQSGATTPMLATAWQWSNNNKTLTFTIRNGVKWDDGQPMSAGDVVFTFNMLKKFGALDLNGIWSYLSSVTQTGSDQVTMTFNQPAVPDFYYIADQTPIVPQHVWSKIANPVNYTDSNPVGSGPYTVNPCNKNDITYTANKYFWQPGEPHIKKVQYPAFLTNDAANEELANGQAQWGAQYIPSIQSYYKAKSPNYNYWFPPTLNVTLVPNLTDPQLSNVKVRQAMSYAIDRSKVSSIGETGYEPAANQTGVVTPTFSQWESGSAVSAWGTGYDPAKAKQLLESAGYHMGSNGVMVNSAGQQLAFSVINIGGYSDWVASMQVIQQQLKAVGIQITPDNLTNTSLLNDLQLGKFQLGYWEQQVFGPAPYYELSAWLYSPNTAPIGKQAATDFERYSNPQTDALFHQYASATSTQTQHDIMNQLEQVMVTQAPVIPVVEGVDWYQYDTGAFTGWPTAGNPYAQPPAWAYPDNEQVLLHLQAK